MIAAFDLEKGVFMKLLPSSSMRAVAGLVAVLACACIAQPRKTTTAAQVVPVAAPALISGGRLPREVTPRAYTLELEIMPGEDGFAGRAQIMVELANPMSQILLHGKALEVSSVTAHVQGRAIAGRYAQLDDTGLAQLSFNELLPVGNARLEIAYRAPFDKTLTGLYKVQVNGEPYAFTQFEPTSARLAFPCFDEPGWKTPFETWLTVPAGAQAISNTREVLVEMAADGKKRVRFAPTQPLPTYLVAFAVGPFDIVEAAPIAASASRTTPLPLRGVAVHGQGPRLAYALEHTPPLLLALEAYFGIGFPYEKLDLIAVPDFSAGAMENAGAITFRDWLLLIDPEKSPEHQKRAYAQVNAHELAHHWFGNLVTMPYWDDIWLNEAFATFLGHRTVRTVMPAAKSDIDLLGAVLNAMEADSRPSARRIREPITSVHDIANAFDGITYNKGAAVLTMFERYLGAEVFRAGLIEHVRTHAHGVAGAEALIASLSKAAGKDVGVAMNTFLSQPGVPLIEAKTRCEKDAAGKSVAALDLTQSRYLPLGVEAERNVTWQVPVCARYEVGGRPHESCTLLTAKSGSLPLNGCPTWIFPSAGASGYYRFALADADLRKLERRGLAKLTASEKLALADSLRAGFSSDALSAQGVLAMTTALANDPERSVAMAPAALLRMARDHVLDEATRPKLERFVQKLYGSRMRQVGLKSRAGEDGEQLLLRAELANFVADVGRDPSLRGKLAEAGKLELAGTESGVSSELRGLATQVAVQDGDVALFDAAYAKLIASQDPAERGRMLNAIASVVDTRSTRALELTFDPALRSNEMMVPLRTQLGDTRTRAAAWAFVQARYADIIARLGKNRGAALAWLAGYFCSAEAASQAQAFFGPRIAELVGGPRALSSTLETVRSCAAVAEKQRASTAAFFQ